MILNRTMLIIYLTTISSIACLYSTENQPITIKSVQEYDKILKDASKPVIAQFHSGCPICQTTGHYVRQVVSQYPTVQFIEININNVQDLAQRYNITALPTVLIFIPGMNQPLYRSVGQPDQETFEAKIKEALIPIAIKQQFE